MCWRSVGIPSCGILPNRVSYKSNVLSLYRHKSRENAEACKSKVDRKLGGDGAVQLQRSNAP